MDPIALSRWIRAAGSGISERTEPKRILPKSFSPMAILDEASRRGSVPPLGVRRHPPRPPARLLPGAVR
jgi:hypothetical protein